MLIASSSYTLLDLPLRNTYSPMQGCADGGFGGNAPPKYFQIFNKVGQKS